MKPVASFFLRITLHNKISLLFVLAGLVAVGLIAGCGSGISGFSGNTSVTLLASSSANDQLLQFSVGLKSLTLTNQSGSTVSLFTTPQNPEFIHVNGPAEPLLTVSIPQGVYTTATATVDGSQFGCAVLDPATGGIDNGTYQYGNMPSSQVTVKMPAPITITRDAMGLTLDLLVSQSETLSACFTAGGSSTYTINPTFNLTPVTFLSQPTNSSNGKLNGLSGFISAINSVGSGFTVTGSDDAAWDVYTNSSTIFQGVAGASGLVAGMLVDMDLTIQSDGLLMATRVEVNDANPTNLSVWNGPVEFVDTIIPTLYTGARQEYAGLFASTYILGWMPYSFGNAVFQTSGQFSNLQSLPFPATFTVANMVAGQNVNITTHALNFEGNSTPASTVTLLPQTINGTVASISSYNGFDMYTVSLAAYDMFPAFAVQPGQTTLLNNPGSIVVYVDSNTQMMNSGTIGVGSVMRFNGLVFNDNGTLRMDCAQVNDGVAE